MTLNATWSGNRGRDLHIRKHTLVRVLGYQYCLHEHHQAGKLGGRPPGALLVEEVRGCELNLDMAIPSGPRLQG